MPTPTIRLVLAGSFVAALAATAVPAHAQSVPAGDAALIFNQLFNVGGVGDRNSSNFIGSVGCGSGAGQALTDQLNGNETDGVADLSLANSGERSQARDLWRFCDNLVNSGGQWTTFAIGSGATGALDEERFQSGGLAPDELFSQMDQAAAMTRAQLNNVGARIRGLRLAALGFSSDARYAKADGASLNVGPDGSLSISSGLNAGDGMSDGGGLGVFANARFIDIKADGSGVETGSKTDGYGITGGIDYPFSPTFIGGAGFGYTDLDSKFDTFGAGAVSSQATADAAVKNLAWQGFFSYFPNDNIYFDGVIGFSNLSFDFTKVVPTFDISQAGADAFASLTSSPDGDTFFVNVGVGYDLRHESYIFTPSFRLDYLKTKIDGFTEQTSGSDNSLALTVGAQENTSLTATLGGTIAFPRSAASGVYTPYLRAEYVHEFDAQADQIRGFLSALPTATFTLTPTVTDEDYAYVGAGIAGTFANNWSAFADFDTLLGFDDLDNWQVTLGFRRQL